MANTFIMKLSGTLLLMISVAYLFILAGEYYTHTHTKNEILVNVSSHDVMSLFMMMMMVIRMVIDGDHP